MSGAKTIAANRHVRVFERRDAVFGCRRTANRAYEIGHGGSECQNNDLIDTAVVAGNFAALDVHVSLYDSESRVALVNLRDGRVRFASAALSTPGSEASYEAIRGLVVTPAGRLAWIGVRLMRGAIVDAEVRRRVPNSADQTVVLDRARRSTRARCARAVGGCSAPRRRRPLRAPVAHNAHAHSRSNERISPDHARPRHRRARPLVSSGTQPIPRTAGRRGRQGRSWGLPPTG